MIDKIKAVFGSVGNMVLLILAPIGALLSYIFLLRSKVDTLQDSVAESKANKQLAETLTKKEEAKNESIDAEADYRDAVDEYRKSRGTTGNGGSL